MTVYSKKATAKEHEWLRAYEDATTFEALYQDEFDAGTMTFEEVARRNVSWFEQWFGDAMNAIPDAITATEEA